VIAINAAAHVCDSNCRMYLEFSLKPRGFAASLYAIIVLDDILMKLKCFLIDCHYID
jgi:hypothetical protein